MEALDTQGWVLLPAVLDESRVNLWRDRFEAAMPRGATGTRHASLEPESIEGFSGCLPVEAAVRQVLKREFKLFGLSGRDPLPGFGQQGLHTDWLPRTKDEPYAIVTAIWLLDDFTADNGATRLVPSTHLLPGAVPKKWSDPRAHHHQERVIEAPAGSVLVFNGHLWHGGTRNRSRSYRRVLQAQYAGAEVRSPVEI
ncbi:MAG: phytanoyl-CoA dioxygenase family protein [Elusimicrobia bacterium]|nr:phytanoyl-CoA dioxygenase family protein [Elusimicrobiota bacterium]